MTDTDKKTDQMTYKEVIEYIEGLQAYGSYPGLLNIMNLCDKAGNPQNDLTFVHIAGTNGKGSVLAMVSSVLKEAGYRVGRYISPTIFEYRERIQVNEHMISKADLCREVQFIKKACDELVKEGKPHPTIFEVETAMAFHYFKEKKCSLVVLETGLGGLLDATNIVKNTAVAVFTSISYDHMAILGRTLTEIAENKAGILKEGCSAVTLRQDEEVMKVLKERAYEMKVPLFEADSQKAAGIKSGLEKQRFTYGGFKDLEITMAGRYQIDNAVLSTEVIKALDKKGFPVKEQAVRKGLFHAKWRGRFEVIGKNPYFIADGAHNRDGAKRLKESLEFYFTNKRIIYIMGILRDKEYEEIIKETIPMAEQVLTVSTPGIRGLSGYELACEVRKYHNKVTAVDSIQEAVELSYLLADRNTVITAFGSLSYLGSLITAVENRNSIRRDSHGK